MSTVMRKGIRKTNPRLQRPRAPSKPVQLTALASPQVAGRMLRPVRWKFTREEFNRRLHELEHCIQQLAA
jgi:hypothetical protein